MTVGRTARRHSPTGSFVTRHSCSNRPSGRLRSSLFSLAGFASNHPNVLRAIRMSRARRLLADGVGLSKTIQAGLVITELIARRLFEALMASLSRRLGHLKLEIFAWAISGVKMLSLHQR